MAESRGPHLFYLVRLGTNARVLNGDKTPLLVEPGALQQARNHYERLLKAQLHPMGLDEYEDKYVTPQRDAEHAAKRRAYEAHAAQVEALAAAATAMPDGIVGVMRSG